MPAGQSEDEVVQQRIPGLHRERAWQATLSYDPRQVLSVDIDFGHDATSMQIMTTRVADLKQSLRSEPSVLTTAVTAHAGGMTREGNLIVDGAPVSVGRSVAYRAVEPE